MKADGKKGGRMMYRRIAVIVMVALLAGCAKNYDESRRAASDARVAEMKADAERYTDAEKAEIIWSRLAEHIHNGAVTECAGTNIADLEETAASGAAFGWRYAAIADCTPAIRSFVNAVLDFDAADGGPDGRVPFKVYLDGTVADDEAHSNVYEQVAHGLIVCRQALGDDAPDIRELIDYQLELMVRLWIDSEWELHYPDGTPIPKASYRQGIESYQPADAIALVMWHEIAADLGIDSGLDIDSLRKEAKWPGFIFPWLNIPTHSSFWLGWLCIDTTNLVAPGEYRDIAENMWMLCRHEENPYWESIARYCGVEGDPSLSKDMSEPTYFDNPLHFASTILTDAEVITSHWPEGSYRWRWSKNKWVLEVKPPRPLYARYKQAMEWKNSQFRVNGNIGKEGHCRYHGIDLLQLYWRTETWKIRRTRSR